MLPVATLIRPVDIAGATNGRLPQSLLRTVTDGSQRDQLHHLAARAWEAMVAAATADGITLRFTDCYRPYSDQERLFLSRYTRTPLAGRPTKQWQGVTWWLRPGMATAAVPGTSNHGWGLAVDASQSSPTGAEVSLSQQTLAWLLDHAPRFGWSWELQSEPWHLRYVAAENVPAAVIEHEMGGRPEVDMAAIDVAVTTDAQGNGYADIPNVRLAQVQAAAPIVTYPPSAGIFAYGMAQVALAEGANGVAAVVVKGWWPANRLTVRVAYTPA